VDKYKITISNRESDILITNSIEVMKEVVIGREPTVPPRPLPCRDVGM